MTRSEKKGRKLWNQLIRTHKIVATTWQLSDSKHYEPRVIVTWSEGQREQTKSLVFTRAFSIKRDAEEEGLKMARQWIDDGKPELQVGIT